MKLNELKAIIGWVRNNGRNRISDEDKAWAKNEIDRAETFNDLKAIIDWVRKNGKSRISDEDRAWAKAEIEKADTYNDLAKAMLRYLRSAK